MMTPRDGIQIELRGERLRLLPQKAVYWHSKEILMIADPHLGKTGHFRKHGIPVPKEVGLANLELLERLLKIHKAEHVIILGDLFHSRHNSEWDEFLEWRNQYPRLEVTLVIGNHDILGDRIYHASRINLFARLRIGPYLLVHDLETVPPDADESGYILSGHIHPAVKLRGRGRQVMRLPCFYFGENEGILPAFGAFTGTHTIKPQTGDRIYGVKNGQVLELQSAGG